MKTTIRPARVDDRDALIQVEAGATPNLSYVANIFDMFLSDERGEFSVAEVNDKVVACGKFTTLPDGTAWLETIRVLPEYQGRGIGKRIYERFFEIAQEQHVTTMRMYTGTQNAVSKGLAEHFGFELAETFRSASVDPSTVSPKNGSLFQKVVDPAVATELLLAQADEWKRYFVMNRTFYKTTFALCAALVEDGMVYTNSDSGDVLMAGARFMPEAALHIGHFSGDVATCFDFAMQLARKSQSKRVSCLFPYGKSAIQQELTGYGFEIGAGEFIVMERTL